MSPMPFAVLALLLSACTVTLPLHSAWTTRSESGLLAYTGTEVAIVECPAEATVVRLRLQGHGSSGTAHVRLVDPRGQLCFDDTLRADERDTTMQWPARTGAWRCELQFEAFSGGYAIDLGARDQPVRVEISVTGVQFDAGK